MAITSLKSSRDFVRIWFFWKKPAIFIFCLIVLSICLYSFTSTPQYKSVAKMLVLPKPNDELVISPGQDSRQYLSRPVTSVDINTEIQLLESDVVLMETAEYYNKQISSDAALATAQQQGDSKFFAWLKSANFTMSDSEKKIKALFGGLEVEPVLSSNIIMVSLTSPYKEQVSEVLSKLLEVYLKYQKRTYSLGDTGLFYDEQKDYYAQKLAAAEKKLKTFNNRWNIINMESQTAAGLQQIADLQTALNNLEITIAENQAKVEMIANGLKIEGNKLTLSKELRSMPVIVELARGLVPLLIKRTEISKTFTKESREYQQINDQIAMLRKEIREEGLSARRSDDIELKTLQIKKDQIAKKIRELKLQSAEFQQKRESLRAVELEVQIARDNFLKYGSKREDSRLFTKRNESNLSNVVIVEPPTIPTKPDSPNKLLAFQVAVLLGLFAAFVLPFILETVDHKLKTADDIERVVSLPVICSYNEI